MATGVGELGHLHGSRSCSIDLAGVRENDTRSAVLVGEDVGIEEGRRWVEGRISRAGWGRRPLGSRRWTPGWRRDATASQGGSHGRIGVG
jgi:hypothetical protein